MTALIVAAYPDFESFVREACEPGRTVQSIQYRNPLKAMDNVEEIRPDLVIFHHTAYPRHWKPFLSLLRSYVSRDRTPFVLVSDTELSALETEKVVELDVSSVLIGEIGSQSLQSSLKELLQNYILLEEARRAERWTPNQAKPMPVCFAHPATLNLIHGIVLNVSEHGLLMLPSAPSDTEELNEDDTVLYGVLQLNNQIVPFKGNISRVSSTLAVEFSEVRDVLRKPTLSV